MSRSAVVDIQGVSFAPLPETAEGPAAPPVEFAGVEPIDTILRDFRQTLADLARRARRLGPVDAGAMLLVTGCGRGAGTSSLALALAGAAAAETHVLLVDGDLGHPGLSTMLDKPPEFGWEEAIRGVCSFEQPLQYADVLRRVAFLPMCRPANDPGELMKKSALRVWLPQLRQDYGLIVVDGGSIFNTASKWAAWVDASLLVCDARKKQAGDWGSAWDALEEGGCHVLGIVESFVEPESPAAPVAASKRPR